MFTLNPPLSIFVRAVGFGFAGFAFAVILKRVLILLGVWKVLRQEID